MPKILHIIQSLGNGGGPRAMIAAAKHSKDSGDFHHQVISINEADPCAIKLAKEAGLNVSAPTDMDTIKHEIKKADIVQVSWWNTPQIYDFLRSELPEMRLIIWYHVAGDTVPQIITKEVVDYADFALACSPYTYDHPVFLDLSPEKRVNKTGMVYGATDFDWFSGLEHKPHDTFNVGYVGTVSLIKMHPDYVKMNAAIDIPNVRFIICGFVVDEIFKKQADASGRADRFDFRGHVNDVKNIYETLDVFGYPLCKDTYAAAELTLQESMYAGIPPVVFPESGIKKLVINDYTGLVVRSETEYKQAVEYLYHHPEERKRIGLNAKTYARQIFGAKNAAKKLNLIYRQMMAQPKKTRAWTDKSILNIVDQPVTLQDLTGESPVKHTISGAEIFINSLGDTREAQHLTTSMCSENIQELLNADSEIASCPRVMFCNDTGGILQYEGYYLRDPYLRMWAGLVWANQEEYMNAVNDFLSAVNLGFPHWRVYWYLAHADEKTGNFTRARDSLNKVLESEPGFLKAKEMLECIKNNVDFCQDSKPFSVMCPYCNESVYVDRQGQWGCPCCKNEFVC